MILLAGLAGLVPGAAFGLGFSRSSFQPFFALVLWGAVTAGGLLALRLRLRLDRIEEKLLVEDCRHAAEHMRRNPPVLLS